MNNATVTTKSASELVEGDVIIVPQTNIRAEVLLFWPAMTAPETHLEVAAVGPRGGRFALRLELTEELTVLS
ncbi:hypothetical protein SEA_BARNSTORMER_73 [Microbacterium phage Barnstormer]|uniref:Uncharacterized protein n=1 Tax=Microbacterium phage Barnstormer TaxID=3028491 RepID=A0AAF0CJC0_9CAUD|nr:hypothetical protein SEA_BARNSTORMER_73 [Microbacterium phage Barnstormer]WDS52179.1 hypothetical protein SEA_UTZCHIPS_73 [Microbacterium phage UtzChips]